MGSVAQNVESVMSRFADWHYSSTEELVGIVGMKW